ncbi:MAG TPA: PQQ-like beta-propeller repeat protein, partial [Chitinophagaceae bacterium]|nr:PQQ-like beta-propeller repeat protein [Chitinophagaceae bacterium]
GTCKGTSVLYRKKVYVHTDQGYLYSIDILSGEIYKSAATLFPSTLALAAYNGKLYIAADKLYCYDTTFVQQWAYDGGVPCTSSPQIEGDKIYLGIGDKVHSVDLNGNNVWQSPAIAAGSINSSPKVSNGVVYFGAQDKKVYAIKQSDGSPVWDYTTVDKVESSPLIYGGMCLIGSTDYDLYCIDTISGLLRWKYHTLERVNSSPAIHEASNTVLVGSYDFNLYAIDHVSGTLRWKYPAGSLIKSSPVVYGNLIYFTSFDRYIYCVDALEGKLVWKQFMNANSQGSTIVDDLKNGVFSTESGMSQF